MTLLKYIKVSSSILIFLLIIFPSRGEAQFKGDDKNIIISQRQNRFWNKKDLLNPYQLQLDPNAQTEYIDLDGDGDPDVLKSITISGIPIQWIDDDDDMKKGDMEGDTDSDCLMVDRNKDGNFGSYSDVVIDWVDNNHDNKADMQIYADYADQSKKNEEWGPGHLMINMDLDNDGIMNYVDWNNFQLRAWLHEGRANFFQDYLGQTLFLKIHTSPEKINDPRLNWENPFLFYDPDSDGLTEYAVRAIDKPLKAKTEDKYITPLSGNITWISLSYDLDNDNSSGNEFDFDMTLNFRGKEGFSYIDQVHQFPEMRGLPESDQYFMDPRVRQLTQLIYPDHEKIHDLIFSRGKWDEVYFVYDEDDDCNRWERVELYEPKDPYVTGKKNGGLDDNSQSDAVGDRGEWDLDNSGGGNLYVGKFDGRIHLYGAETGYWRIDQNSYYYQGMGGLYDGYGPGRSSQNVQSPYPVVKYSDTDGNGFFDKMEYDLDGDKRYDEIYSLLDLGIDDRCEVLETGAMNYEDLLTLERRVSYNMWYHAMAACRIAEKAGINLSWYALLMHPKSIRQKYNMGYWLQFYLFRDLLYKAINKEENQRKVLEIIKAYHSARWDSLTLDL